MRPRRDIRLVIADVDGTLLTSDNRLTTRTCDAARKLREHDVALAITSGRPPRGLFALVGPLGITTPVSGFNGGMLVAPDLRTIITQRVLSLAVAEEVVDRLLRGGLDVWVYRRDDWFVRDLAAPHIATEQATVQFAPTVVGDLRPVLEDAVKILGVSDDVDLVAGCEADLRDRLGHVATVSRSQPFYLDITHPDAHKGTVVHDIASALDISLTNVAAIGDRPTDVLMFALAGTSIAMGNASTEVRRCARHVTMTNDQDGFAAAVVRFVLREPTSVQARLGLPPRVEACLFDLDGVLTQTARLHAEAWKTVFDDVLRAHAEARGAPFVPFDAVAEYRQYVDGRPRADGVRTFLAARGISLPEGAPGDPPGIDTVHAIGSRKNELVLQLFRERPIELYEGSLRYVRAAHDAGLKTAVVSSSKNTQQVIASAGIADLFDVRVDGVVAEERHLAGKPAPDTFLAAAEQLGVEPGRAAVFEDALAGVQAGHAGHFGFVVGVDRIGQAVELRRHGADVVVEDLELLLEVA